MAVALSSGQWNMDGSDVYHCSGWPIETSLHNQSPFHFWLVEWRQLHGPSPQSNLENHLLKAADPQDEEVCWRARCIPPSALLPPPPEHQSELSDEQEIIVWFLFYVISLY